MSQPLITNTLVIDQQSKKIIQQPHTLPELTQNQVRIKVMYSGISKNDLLYLDGIVKNDYFGAEIVGRIVALGKNAGGRKLNEIVGVSFNNVNHGQFFSGYADYVQTSINNLVYIPNTIQPQHAAGLLGSGLIAFNALQKLQKGSSVAIVGTNNIAYLAVQFAKKAFGLNVTVFHNTNSKPELNADAYELLTAQNIKKWNEKFDATVLTEQISLDIAKVVQNLSLRTGKVYICTHLGYNPQIIFFDLVVNQRQIIGVKRGINRSQMVKMLQAAAFNSILGRIQTFKSKQFQQGFKRARQINVSSQIILRY